MLVRDHMTSKVISIGAERPIAEALRLLVRHRIRQLPVLRKGQLVGIITHRDLRAKRATAKTVAGLMTAKPFVIGADAAVDEAAQRLRTYKIGALPVVEDKRLIGIITVADVLDAFVTLSGIRDSSYRLIVTGRGGAQMEARARRAIERARGELKWLHRGSSQRPAQLHMRVKLKRPDALVDALEAEGLSVAGVIAAAHT